MQGIAEAIKYLYQQFILRDVVAYVAPGAVLAGSILKVLLGTQGAVAFLKDIPTIAYLPIYGALFMTGLAMENLGEMVGLLRFHNRRSHMKCLDDKKHFEVLQKFHRFSSAKGDADKNDGYGSWLERTRERITVKKYASGNFVVAILISMILIFVTKLRPPELRLWATAFVGVILIASLLRAHWHQLKLQVIWEDEALKDYDQDKTGKIKSSSL